MSVEFRLHKPVMIVYTEYHPAKVGGTDEIELKVETVRTIEEAAALEYQCFSRWAERIRGGEYVPPPWSCTTGSPTMQLLAHLFAETCFADKIISHEKPVMPKDDRAKIDIPEEITPQWLANYLSLMLNVSASGVSSAQEWHNTGVRWNRESEMDLVACHGKSARSELLMTFAACVKLKFDGMPDDKIVAIGVKSTSDDFVARYVVYFKLKGDGDG